MSLISSILSIIYYIDFAIQSLLFLCKLEKQTYIFNSSISAKSLSNFSTIRFCSANGGNGTTIFFKTSKGKIFFIADPFNLIELNLMT